MNNQSRLIKINKDDLVYILDVISQSTSYRIFRSLRSIELLYLNSYSGYIIIQPIDSRSRYKAIELCYNNVLYTLKLRRDEWELIRDYLNIELKE